MKISELSNIFFNQNIEFYGTCKFEEVLPIINCRAANRLPINPKTVIVCLFPYYIGDYSKRNISRYALGNDYHKIISDILFICCEKLKEIFPKNSFEFFVDNSPIREVFAASAAKLGSIGKNNQLINYKYGTYTFIGTIVTDLEIENDITAKTINCLNCDKCINACPTKALSPNGFNKAICRSHITQTKGVLSDYETEQIKLGNFVWGCDICNDICPLNKNPINTPIKQMYDNVCDIINEDNIENLIKDKAFEYRGINVIKRNIELLNK